MGSAGQIAANRQNCLRSTGPRTGQGKFSARANVMKHGFTARTVWRVLPHEDPRAFADRITAWTEDWQPPAVYDPALNALFQAWAKLWSGSGKTCWKRCVQQAHQRDSAHNAWMAWRQIADGPASVPPARELLRGIVSDSTGRLGMLIKQFNAIAEMEQASSSTGPCSTPCAGGKLAERTQWSADAS